jgi:hypothetical protein
VNATQAKEQALNHSMEQAIKQSVRELVCWCHNTVQDQHSKANSSCWVFTRSNREQMLGRAVTPRIRRKCIVWSITEVISRPGKLAQDGVVQIPSRFPVAVPVRRAAAGWRAGQAPCTPRAVVARMAQHNLVHPILRARIPAQISPSTPVLSCRQLSQNWHS